MIGSRKRWVMMTVTILLVGLGFYLVPPELKYRRALQKYMPGISADTLVHDYGVSVHLEGSGNVLPFTASEDEKRRHIAFIAFIPQEYVVVYFNDDREIIDTLKLTPLQAIRKRAGL